VDVGVHQDGLVHISALSNQFVKDPHTVVKTGDVVKVKVMEVDLQRKRIALTMRLDDEVQAKSPGKESGTGTTKRLTRSARPSPVERKPEKPAVGSFGALLQDAAKSKK
jgi:uncharacterized protein